MTAISYLNDTQLNGEALAQLASTIAKELPGVWTVKRREYNHAVDLCDENDAGAGFVLIGTWKKGQLVIHGAYPSNYATRERPEINVSFARPAAAIAKDIARRFLPAYRAALTAERTAKKMWDDHTAEQEANAAEVGQLLGPHGRYTKGQDRPTVHVYGGDSLYGCFDGATIELKSVPRALLLDIVKLVRVQLDKDAARA